MTMSTSFHNLINGEWVAGASEAPNINPSDTRDVIGLYAQADAAQAEAAIGAAHAAFPAWSRSTPQQRFDLLDAVGNELLARKDEIGRRRRVGEDRNREREARDQATQLIAPRPTPTYVTGHMPTVVSPIATASIQEQMKAIRP